MNTHELTERVSDVSGLSKKDTKAVIDAVFAAIAEAAVKGEDTAIAGFGKFAVKDIAQRKGRNPQTGAEITIPAARKLGFTAGKALKDSMNS